MATGLDRRQYVRMLSAVFASMFLIRVAFGVTVVTFGGYLSNEGDFTYSLVVTAAPLLELITVVFAGALIDRYGRKGVLLTGLGLGAVSLYGLALTKNVFLLGVVNAIHGIAAALILVTTLAIIATHAPPDHRGREMGLFNLSNIFGWLAGFGIGSLLLDPFAGRLEYTFVISGAMATAGLLYANRMIQLPHVEAAVQVPSHAPSVEGLLATLRNTRILFLTIPWLIVFILIGAFIAFFPRVGGNLDVDGSRMALGILATGGLFVVSQIFWGRLADKAGREVVMLIGAVGFAALMGVIVYAFFETDSLDAQALFAKVMSHWILLGIFTFIALAFASAGLAAIADEAKEGNQGTTMSTYSLTLSLGFILGPPALGAVSENFGGKGMVVFFASLAVLLVALVLTMFIQARTEEPAPAVAHEGG